MLKKKKLQCLHLAFPNLVLQSDLINLSVNGRVYCYILPYVRYQNCSASAIILVGW